MRKWLDIPWKVKVLQNTKIYFCFTFFYWILCRQSSHTFFESKIEEIGGGFLRILRFCLKFEDIRGDFKMSISLYGLVLSWTSTQSYHSNHKSWIFKQRSLFMLNALHIRRKHTYYMIRIILFSFRVSID